MQAAELVGHLDEQVAVELREVGRVEIDALQRRIVHTLADAEEGVEVGTGFGQPGLASLPIVRMPPASLRRAPVAEVMNGPRSRPASTNSAPGPPTVIVLPRTPLRPWVTPLVLTPTVPVMSRPALIRVTSDAETFCPW